MNRNIILTRISNPCPDVYKRQEQSGVELEMEVKRWGEF